MYTFGGGKSEILSLEFLKNIAFYIFRRSTDDTFLPLADSKYPSFISDRDFLFDAL